MKTILLTNDDGYLSKGLTALKAHLMNRYRVITVAPDRERSAVSMGLTLNNPLRLKSLDHDTYVVNGTPADCVNLGLSKVVTEQPDLIVSGMNLGENLGEDIFFSGTVGAAFVAHIYGIPSVAFSMIPRDFDYVSSKYNYKESGRMAGIIVDKLINLQKKMIYSVNIPYEMSGGIEVTTLGTKNYSPDVAERSDPRGRKCFWIGTGKPKFDKIPGTDVHAVFNKTVSVTPLDYRLDISQTLRNEVETCLKEDK